MIEEELSVENIRRYIVQRARFRGASERVLSKTLIDHR